MTSEECIAEATRRLNLADFTGALALAHELIEKHGHPQGARIGAIAARMLGDDAQANRLAAAAVVVFSVSTPS